MVGKFEDLEVWRRAVKLAIEGIQNVFELQGFQF